MEKLCRAYWELHSTTDRKSTQFVLSLLEECVEYDMAIIGRGRGKYSNCIYSGQSHTHCRVPVYLTHSSIHVHRLLHTVV